MSKKVRVLPLDPSLNVKEQLRAVEHRLDNLRESAIERQRELRLQAESYENRLRKQAVVLSEVRAEGVEKTASLRAKYEEKISKKESLRIDAIRSVDVGAVNRSAEVSATQALTLATQVATSAETLRTQVAAAASAQTIALAAALEPIQKDIADLRRVQYEQQGQKSASTDSRSFYQILIAGAGVVAALLGSGVVVIVAIIVK
jgi:hypothetical protein